MVTAIYALPFYLLGLWKRVFLYFGLILQGVYILTRGLHLGRLPLVGPHDTLIFLSAAMVAFSIPFNRGTKGHPALSRGISFAAMVFTASGILWQPHNAPLPPVLKTLWFELHVVLAFFSYALFGIGAAIGVFSLRQKEVFREALQYRAILIGYCLFSLSMILGGIWAYLAWGTYWLWTPKELWTSIVWLFYTLYLHARLMQGWSGRPLASLGILGFVVVMFTYLGVSLFMKSSHTF